jgi:hypothetical protein
MLSERKLGLKFPGFSPYHVKFDIRGWLLSALVWHGPGFDFWPRTDTLYPHYLYFAIDTELTIRLRINI